MTLREAYLDAAEYVRKHGFSYRHSSHGEPRCFIGTLRSVTTKTVAFRAYFDGPLRRVLNVPFADGEIAEQGWTKNDAIAAFEIAADLATP